MLTDVDQASVLLFLRSPAGIVAAVTLAVFLLLVVMLCFSARGTRARARVSAKHATFRPMDAADVQLRADVPQVEMSDLLFPKEYTRPSHALTDAAIKR